MRQIAGPRGIITVTAIDHRGSLEAMLKRALPGQPIGFAEMAGEKGDQAMRGGDIGANRVLGAAALAGQMVVPAPRDGVRAMVLL